MASLTKIKNIKNAAKIPSSWQLLKKSWLEAATFWQSLIGVTAVYAVLYFLFVMGLSFTSFLQDQVSYARNLPDAFNNVVSSLSGAYGSGQSDATVLIQYLLFIIASLAIIWTLRKLQALKKVTIRDAYYQGNSGIIVVILVTIALVLCMLPAVLGSAIFGIALQPGGAGVEVIVSILIAGILLFISLFLFAMFWPAFYIASLPQTRPIQALKSAKALTKKRRLSILRKMVFLMLCLALLIFIILLPIALMVPAVTPYGAYVILFAAFAFMHIYLYQLYRSLL